MSIICVFILNQDFTGSFSPMKTNIFKNFGLKFCNDAHNRNWKEYSITDHPRFGHKITAGSMIVKLN